MYRKHFGLHRLPFTNGIDTEELFVSNALRELQVRWAHLVELRGIGVITGESGSGKTTTSRKVVAGLHTGLHRVLYVCLTTGNVMDMYKTIAWELGLPIERNVTDPRTPRRQTSPTLAEASTCADDTQHSSESN